MVIQYKQCNNLDGDGRTEYTHLFKSIEGEKWLHLCIDKRLGESEIILINKVNMLNDFSGQVYENITEAAFNRYLREALQQLTINSLPETK